MRADTIDPAGTEPPSHCRVAARSRLELTFSRHRGQLHSAVLCTIVSGCRNEGGGDSIISVSEPRQTGCFHDPGKCTDVVNTCGDVSLGPGEAARCKSEVLGRGHRSGNQPPLSVDGAASLVDRRRLSVQWFSETIQTGPCGVALMAAPFLHRLIGETNFDRTRAGRDRLRGAISSIGDRLSGLRKTDRLPALSERTSRGKSCAFRLRRASMIGANWSACVPTCA